jgi:acetyl-CoA carboxylase biotin carboxyl carrier protein
MSENAGSAKAADKSGQTGKKGAAKSAGKIAKPSLNMKELQELAELVDEHGFTDFEFENENIRVRLSKNPPPHYIQAQPTQGLPVSSTSATVPTSELKAETSADAQIAVEDLYQITSPIVGTFYSSPSPDKDPYVKEGSSVSADSVVCIVEAMKLMNEIQAEVSGEVVKIYVENGQPVEYGQPLFGIRK